jgi:multisubunit Na+/H+ antiporter MnhB subunit
MWRDTLRAEAAKRREPARRLVNLLIVLAVAVAVIGLAGYYMQTSGMDFSW